MTPSTYMVVLQGALQGKRCKIVANKVGWKFVDIVAQNRKKNGMKVRINFCLRFMHSGMKV